MIYRSTSIIMEPAVEKTSWTIKETWTWRRTLWKRSIAEAAQRYFRLFIVTLTHSILTQSFLKLLILTIEWLNES